VDDHRAPLDAAGVALRGRTAFDWYAGGAFLRMRSEIADTRIPSGITLIGSDDATDHFTMLYFDERGVSRRFETTMEGAVMRWWRMAPGFSQRFTLTVAAEGDSLHGVSALSKDDATWEQDLALTYTRVR
jgi:hypothetical protein